MENNRPPQTPTQSWQTVFDNGMLKLSKMFRTDLDSLLVSVYQDGLVDLPEAALRMVFTKALLECKFMPTIAELRGFIKEGRKRADNLDAEKNWEACCDHLRKYGEQTYNSDKPLGITAAGEHAFRAIGWRSGLVKVLDYDAKGMDFAHKRFIEAYNYHVETGGLVAVSREEAVRLLEIAKKGHVLAEAADETD